MFAAERVYRMKSSQRIVGIVLVAVFLLVVVAIWSEVFLDTRAPNFFEMMAPVVALLFVVAMAIRSFHNAVIVSDQRIDLRGISGTRSLPLDKIKGRRRYLSQGDAESPDVWHLVIESDDDRFPNLDMEELYRFDDEFYAWFTALPDLDELDKTRPKPSNFGLA